MKLFSNLIKKCLKLFSMVLYYNHPKGQKEVQFMESGIIYTKWNELKKILSDTKSDSIGIIDRYMGFQCIEHSGLDAIKTIKKHYYVNEVNYKIVSFIDDTIKIYITRVDC